MRTEFIWRPGLLGKKKRKEKKKGKRKKEEEKVEIQSIQNEY